MAKYKCVINGESPSSPVVAEFDVISEGLTKREAFAMAAMQNILSHYNPYESGDFDSSEYNVTASHAVGLADALLKELEK